MLYGFVYLLAYSRYLFVHFYPRHSLEFFLDGHLRAFQEIGGLAHRHRYDNLKSVVLKRTPEITFNPQFLEFSRHYGFSIHPCTPGRADEKQIVYPLGYLFGSRFFDDATEYFSTGIGFLKELNAAGWELDSPLASPHGLR